MILNAFHSSLWCISIQGDPRHPGRKTHELAFKLLSPIVFSVLVLLLASFSIPSPATPVHAPFHTVFAERPVSCETTWEQ